MAQIQVFVSHSHEDDTFCRGIVSALRGGGADVWYDEHNLSSGQLVDTIERELKARPVVLVILSPAALASPWVRDECKWAYSLLRRDSSRIILPVTAAPLEEDAIWMFLSDFKRIEAPGLRPFPLPEACGRLLHALALTAPGAVPVTPTPQPTASVEELLVQGKALMAQQKYVEALPFFERAALRDPSNAVAWANMGHVLNELARWKDALAAFDHSLAINPDDSTTWNNKARALGELKRNEEALAATERALAIDPDDEYAWTNKGDTLNALGRPDEALAALDRALSFDPELAATWNNRGMALDSLERYEDALAAYDRALALDPNFSYAWNNRGITLVNLGQYDEAMSCFDQARVIEPNYAEALNNKGVALDNLGRYDEAMAAYDQALALNPTYPAPWDNKALVLRKLGHTKQARAAEKRAKELGGQRTARSSRRDTTSENLLSPTGCADCRIYST